MAIFSADVNTGQRYRMFARQDNPLSIDGVSVTMQACGSWEVALEFWTREDAVAWFEAAADAARRAPRAEDDVMMSEATATAFEDLRPGGT